MKNLSNRLAKDLASWHVSLPEAKKIPWIFPFWLMKSLRITIESHEIPWNQSPCKSHEYAPLGWLNPIKSQYKAASYHLRWSTVSSLSFMHTDTMTSFAKVHCSCRQESLAVKLEGSYGLIFYICGDLMGFNHPKWAYSWDLHGDFNRI